MYRHWCGYLKTHTHTFPSGRSKVIVKENGENNFEYIIVKER